MPSNFTVAGNDTDNIFLLRTETDEDNGSYWGIWAMGRNNQGQLGLGDRVHRSSPSQVGSLGWSRIATGRFHTLAISPFGTLWSWGSNSNGELGINSTFPSQTSSPVQVGSFTDWTRIAGGSQHSFGIRAGGTLWAWGGNSNFVLGLSDSVTNSGARRYSPVQVGSLSNWADISTGSDGTSALSVKTDGTLWSWGYNRYGQLGQGDLVHRSSPTQIGSLTNWSQIAISLRHALSVKTDGTLWAWGANNFGQLGLGDLVHRSSPVQVGSLTNWSRVAVGHIHSLAVKTDGTLWAWGRNDYNGALGTGDLVSRSSPVQIGTLTNWSQVSAGANSLALKTDGTLWSWGTNTYGQLGQNDLILRSSPVQIGTFTNWTQISASRYASAGIRRVR